LPFPACGMFPRGDMNRAVCAHSAPAVPINQVPVAHTVGRIGPLDARRLAPAADAPRPAFSWRAPIRGVGVGVTLSCRGPALGRRPSEPGDSGRSQKPRGAIPRREFVTRDPPIARARISLTGACHDGRRSNHPYSRRQRQDTSAGRFPAGRGRTPGRG